MKRSVFFLLAGFVAAALLVSGCTQSPAATPAPATPTPAVTTPAPTPREPKRLEEKITIEMGEHFLADAKGVRGGPFKVSANKTVGIHVVNKGTVGHEVLFGREVKVGGDYKTNLFENIPVDAFAYPSGKKIEVATEGKVAEVELEPGADVWLRVKFPESAKGEWEIGCFVEGHYEAGMKAKFIIE